LYKNIAIIPDQNYYNNKTIIQEYNYYAIVKLLHNNIITIQEYN